MRKKNALKLQMQSFPSKCWNTYISAARVSTQQYTKCQTVISHAGFYASVGRACSRVCLFVHALTGKRLELSIPNLVHVHSIAVARHALTQRSKGQRSRSHGYKNRHSRTVASDHIPYSVYQYAAVLPVAIAGVVCLHVDTTACFPDDISDHGSSSSESSKHTAHVLAAYSDDKPLTWWNVVVRI